MRLMVKTKNGTVCASYLRSPEDEAIGIRFGLLGNAPVASLEQERGGRLSLVIDHDALSEQKIRLVSRIGGLLQQ